MRLGRVDRGDLGLAAPAVRCHVVVHLLPHRRPGHALHVVLLVVQNLNPQPEGMAPEEAATVIGVHVLSAHAVPAALVGCGAITLLDHVFDVT